MFLGNKGEKKKKKKKKHEREKKGGREKEGEPASVVANERGVFSDKDCHLVEL